LSKRWFTLIYTVLLAWGLCALFLLLPRAAQSTAPKNDNHSPTIDITLQEAMDQAPAGTFFPAIVHLAEQANLTPQTLPAGKQARRNAVVERLQTTAATTQAPLLPLLDARQAAGEIEAYTPYWIFNGVQLSASAPVLRELARRPEVARIVSDAQVQIEHDPVVAPVDNSPEFSAVTWGLKQVQAPQTWYGLNVSGAGVTVGIMDSGVDWLHPALRPNYRGQLPNGSLNHVGNWHDALDDTNVTPVDPFGHGTHVAGTILGLENVGVAPEAKWMAVRAFDVRGSSDFGTIHAAFQWLLAPAGDPALAPDIVNNSWSSGPEVDEFLADIAAFKAAGILMVFSAGNSGNAPGTIGTPAAYTDTIAVGAMDERHQLTWFSSTGPSIFTNRTKPELIAPGARVLSTLPGNSYGYANGTSMSAPHVSGAAALLLSANPALTPPAITQIITTTAAPFADNTPNDQSGWGVLDAYAATATQVDTGRVAGIVRVGSQPLAGVTITVNGPAGVPILFYTDVTGHYQIDLVPGQYDLHFTAFGTSPAHLTDLAVTPGAVFNRDISLMPLPAGNVQGVIRDADTNQGLPAFLRAVGTPVTTTANALGEYQLSLPAGTYILKVAHTGYRLDQITVTVPAGGNHNQDFDLSATDRVLLVDSGWWYYHSQAAYYRQGLNNLGIAHDEWPVYNPFQDSPELTDLTPYDTVIWSAPNDSPGAIGAGLVISQYLGTGGNLFISGSSIGAIDGNVTPEAWWFVALRAMYVTSLRPVGTPPVYGQPETPFAGMTFTLNGGDGAANQSYVDQVAPLSGSFTDQAMNYGQNRGAALIRGRCVPAGYRVVYLGFGLEGVSTETTRHDILERSFSYFHEPPQPAGVEITPESISDFALPGRALTLTLEVFNESETITDTFQLDLHQAPWPTRIVTPTLETGPCASRQTQLIVEVPPDAPDDTTFTFTLSATSTNAGLRDEMSIALKTPGEFLFVDDHRFFDETAAYTATLDSLDIRYDVWETGWGSTGRGSPSPHFLAAYDLVLWYTGYDWFEPLSKGEADTLAGYLDGGGRLFLSSQDTLYYHDDHRLTSTYFGVEQYSESVTPTIAYGGPDLLVGDDGPFPLVYPPYQNNSDGLLGTASTQPFLYHNGGGAAGLAHQGVSPAGPPWRTVFWAIPWEKLPESARRPTLSRILGQLGDLGESTFETSARSPLPGQTLAYTLTLRHQSAGEPGTITITNPLPPELNLDETSLSGGAQYDPLTRIISWSGQLVDGAEQEITYRAEIDPALVAGELIHNAVALHYARHNLTHTLTARSWVDAPNLQESILLASQNPLPAGKGVTYTLLLINEGTPGMISATAGLPPQLFPLTSTLTSSTGTAEFQSHQLSWAGTIPAGGIVTVTMVMTSAWNTGSFWYPTNLVVNDGVTPPLVSSLWLQVTPFKIYQPAVFSQPPRD
jgi:subtilisin family serine protease